LTLLINLDHSIFGPTPPEVAAAVSHLCGFFEPDEERKLIPADDYYQVAKDYYDGFLRSDPSGEQSLSLLCYLSAYYHELRHVHDLMSTTYGQTVLFTNLNYYQNMPSLVAELSHWQERYPTRSIKLPLGPNLSEMKDIDENLRKLILQFPQIHRTINKLDDAGNGFHGRLTVRHLLECTATNVQSSLVNDIFGDDAHTRLIQFISEGAAAPAYWQINSDMLEAFYAKGFRGRSLGRLISYLAWCALFGGIQSDGQKGDGVSIVNFYQALVEHVVHNIDVIDFESVRSLVDEFCDTWGLQRPAQNVETTRAYLEGRAQRMETAWHDSGASEIGAPIVAAYKKIVGAFADINEVIGTFPEQYFGNYFWLVATGKLPSAHLFIKRNGQLLHGLSSGTELLPVNEWDYIAHMSSVLTVLLEGPNKDSDFWFLQENALTNLETYAPNGVRLKLEY
jgi:hypothetical protein